MPSRLLSSTGNLSRFFRLLHPTTRFNPNMKMFRIPRRFINSSERDHLLSRLSSKRITEQEVRNLIETSSSLHNTYAGGAASNDPSIRSMSSSQTAYEDHSFYGMNPHPSVVAAIGSRMNPIYTRRVTGIKDLILSLFPLVFIFWAFGGFDMIKLRRAASGSGSTSGSSSSSVSSSASGGLGGSMPGMFGKNFTEWTETDWDDDDDKSSDDDEISEENPLDPRGMISDPRDDFFARLGISMDGKRIPSRLGALKNKKKNDKGPNRRRRKRTRFTDVCGNEEAKIDMMDLVDYLKNPNKYSDMGCKLPRGVLLYGAPGTGKTLLAKALAGEAGVPFLSCNGASFDEIFVGVGVMRVRKLFERAKEISPCIIFIDEIDAIANTRMSVGSAHASDSLNALLSELDGFDSDTNNNGVVVVAATNMVDRLDPALVRPGRFDRKIKVTLPDKKARVSIVKLYLKKLRRSQIDDDVFDDGKLEELVADIHGFSGAELENMVNIASIEAVKSGEGKLLYSHLIEAKEQIGMGRARAHLQLSEEQTRLTAYHESGHAIVSLYTKGSKEIYKATILPRGDALGYVASTNQDEFMSTKESLLAHLDMCMGGRIAEEMIFGKDRITTGASSDFSQATNLATAMVIHYGMSEAVGHVFYEKAEVSKLSPDLQNLINREIKRYLDESEARARSLLLEHEKELHLLAKSLLERETLDGREIKRILGIGDKNSENENGKDSDRPDGKVRRGQMNSSSRRSRREVDDSDLINIPIDQAVAAT